MPERFGLTYIDKDGSAKPVVMIHKALLGSVERFLGVYLEHTNGHLPVWLAPEQLRIATLNDSEKVVSLAAEILAMAKDCGVRATLDDSNESVGKKIHDAEAMKVPYTVVIGSKEVESGQLGPRNRSDLPEIAGLPVDELLEKLSQVSKSRQ